MSAQFRYQRWAMLLYGYTSSHSSGSAAGLYIELVVTFTSGSTHGFTLNGLPEKVNVVVTGVAHFLFRYLPYFI